MCVYSTGRQQADITGQRLRDLDLDYTRMVSSTMARAVETADIIHKYLPGLLLDRDDVLREGAPIRPEPYHSSWRPESHVCHLFIKLSHCFLQSPPFFFFYFIRNRSFFFLLGGGGVGGGGGGGQGGGGGGFSPV